MTKEKKLVSNRIKITAKRKGESPFKEKTWKIKQCCLKSGKSGDLMNLPGERVHTLWNCPRENQASHFRPSDWHQGSRAGKAWVGLSRQQPTRLPAKLHYWQMDSKSPSHWTGCLPNAFLIGSQPQLFFAKFHADQPYLIFTHTSSSCNKMPLCALISAGWLSMKTTTKATSASVERSEYFIQDLTLQVNQLLLLVVVLDESWRVFRNKCHTSFFIFRSHWLNIRALEKKILAWNVSHRRPRATSPGLAIPIYCAPQAPIYCPITKLLWGHSTHIGRMLYSAYLHNLLIWNTFN